MPPNCLPAGLRSLCISTQSFNPHYLAGALPAGLRVLRLHCRLTRPLAAKLLSMVPQLEELDLGGHYSHPPPAPTHAALTQLRVLRVGSSKQPRERFTAGELPTSLQRLTVVAETTAAREEAERLVPVDVRHAGLLVEVQSAELYKAPTIAAILAASGGSVESAV